MSTAFASSLTAPLKQSIVAAFIALVSNAGLAQVTDLEDAVYKSARQAMLTERISKAYLSQTLNVEGPTAKRITAESVAQFDRHLIELKVFAPTAEIKASLAQIETRWTAFKEQAVGTAPSLSSARRVLELDAELVRLAIGNAQQFQKRSTTQKTNQIFIAESEAMLSQRVAMLYFATLLEITPTNTLADMNKARDEFLLNMKTMRESRTLPATIMSKITVADSQWAFLDKAIANRGDAKNRIALGANAFKASERVLEVLDDIALTLDKMK